LRDRGLVATDRKPNFHDFAARESSLLQAPRWAPFELTAGLVGKRKPRLDGPTYGCCLCCCLLLPAATACCCCCAAAACLLLLLLLLLLSSIKRP